MIPRRRCLAALAATGLGAALAPTLSGCAAAGPGAARVSGEPVPVADGVWLLPGAPGEIDSGNLGRVGNISFIVGKDSVLVVDSGASLAHGQAALTAIARTTAKPVKLLLLTHARQEFVFGACAFQQRGIPVAMGTRSAQLMAARCEGCLKALRRLLGDGPMTGTVLVKPDILIDTPGAPPPAWQAALAGFGRPLRLLGFGHSSGPGDLALLDERSGTLIAGGLADVQRIPDVQDADLPGWQQGLTALRSLPLARIVGGHGPAAPAAANLAELQRYLQELDTRTLALAREGLALSEVPDACALPHFAAWDQFDTIHRRNASILFLRHERALLRE